MPRGKPKFGQKLTFWPGSNSEAIQHIMLKLTMGECLNRHYVRTKFRPNPRGQVFFCVDLTWNDPCTSTDSLLFIQNSLHCKQGGLYETSFLYVLQLFPPVIIQTRSSFLIPYSGCYPPVTIETGTSFLSSFTHLLSYKQEHHF